MGVIQAGISSPIFFNIYIEQAADRLRERVLTFYFYADDLIILVNGDQYMRGALR